MISFLLSLFNIRPYLAAYGLNVTSLIVFCFIWGMAGALISLALSKSMAKWMMGIKTIGANTRDGEEKLLYGLVEKLTRKEGLPMPEVGIYPSNEVNAFATGPTKEKSLVAVSSGLLRRMKENELEAVLAHEVTHIANGDMVTMALLQGVVNAFVMFLARVLAYIFSGLGRDRNRQGGSMMSYILFVYLFEVVFMILGSLVVAAFSRFREFRADRGGARLAGKESMIGALQTLRAMQEIRDAKAENPAMAAFKISHPTKKGLFHLFASHPPLEERIERLRSS